MDGDQLGAVGERAFDLDLGNHLGHALHDRVGGRIVAPRLMISATVRPSRIISRISDVMSATASG